MAEKANNYALIIGVSDYSAFDASVGNPAGTSTVPGARNDAAAWFRQCIEMGFAADRIRVLTAPTLSLDELGPEAITDNIALADHANIVAGMNWLAEMTGGDTPSAGLMTFSGHGSGHDAHSLALELCPCNTVTAPGGGLDNIIDVGTVRRTLGSGPVARRLTAVLDCCNAQVGNNPATSIRARLRSGSQGGDPAAGSAPLERVLSACAWDQTSQSSHFLGLQMGAFTWAMTSTISQWKTTLVDGMLRLNASNGQLIRKSRNLLETLEFDQHPVLTGPLAANALGFLAPAGDPVGGIVNPRSQPDAPRTRKQLDSGQRTGDPNGFTQYTFEYWTSQADFQATSPPVQPSVLTTIIANGNGQQTVQFTNGNGQTSRNLNANREYWDVHAGNAWTLRDATSQWVLRFRSTGFQPWPASPSRTTPSDSLFSRAPESSAAQGFTSSPSYPSSPGWVTFSGDYLGGTLAVSFKLMPAPSHSQADIIQTMWYQPGISLLDVPSNWPVILTLDTSEQYPVPLGGTAYVRGPLIQAPVPPITPSIHSCHQAIVRDQ